MPRLYKALYKYRFWMLWFMPYGSLATQSTDIDSDSWVYIHLEVSGQCDLRTSNPKEIKKILKKNLKLYNLKKDCFFKVQLQSIEKTIPGLFRQIKMRQDVLKSSKKLVKPLKEHVFNIGSLESYYPIDSFSINELFGGNDVKYYIVWDAYHFNAKTIFFYVIGAISNSTDCLIYRLEFNNAIVVPDEELNTRVSSFDNSLIPLQTILPSLSPMLTTPASTSSKLRPEVSSSTNKKKLNKDVKLQLIPLNDSTKQFIRRYSCDKKRDGGGLFNFKKYPQHVSCLALREKFAEKISKELDKLPRLGIQPAFIYFYNAKKEKINLSKKHLPHYNPSIKQLYQEQALDKQGQTDSLSRVLILSLFYKITYYPTLFQKFYQS